MATQTQLPPLTLEGRRLLFRNFGGKPDRFNAAGQRNFAITLDPDEAQRMEADGWNVKWLPAREDGDEPQAILKVNLKYSERGRPPRVVMITEGGKTNLDESMVEVLDWAVVVNADVIIRAYHYDIGGKTGVSAYVNSLWVTILEDDLEKKYRDVPDSGDPALEPDDV
jgi:hypothetical protein